MTQQAAVGAPAKRTGRRRPVRRGALARLVREPLGVVSIGILSLVILVAVFAPVLVPHDPNATDLAHALARPGGSHLLGTDSAGRDVLSRLLLGARPTLIGAAIATVVAALLGVTSGLLAGYYGSWLDSLLSWLANIVLSMPAVVILIAARSAIGPNMWITMALFGVLFSPSFFRLVRTSVITVRKELYVDAARVSGLSDVRIIGRHVLAVVRAPIIIQAALIAGIAIAVQAGLEFLGLGDLSRPTWGMTLNESFGSIFTDPLLVLWPALAIGFVTVSFALLGNALRDALEEGDTSPRVSARLPAASAAVTAEPQVAVARQPTTPVDSRSLLWVRDLSISYVTPEGDAKKVVDSVSFDIHRGEVLGLVGESGSGKTQTAFAILGLLPRDARVSSGQIVFDGLELVSPTEGSISRSRMDPLRGTRIAYVPQEPMSNLDPAFTVGRQLVRPMVKRLGLTKTAATQRALDLLDTVGIADPKRAFAAYPHEISGGMAQRVLIAGAVSCSPDLLIADEPTTALDVTVQAEVLDLLRDLQQDLGMAVLLVTHNLGVVADICNRVVVMQQACLREVGDVASVLGAPQHPYTRRLLASTLEGRTPRTALLGLDREDIG